MPAGLEELTAAVEQAVEFVDEEVGRLVGVFRGDGGEKIRTADLDMPLGHENGAAAGRVVLKVDSDAINPRFVAEEAFGFCAKRVAQGVGESEMDTAKKDLRAGVGGMRMDHRPFPTGGHRKRAV